MNEDARTLPAAAQEEKRKQAVALLLEQNDERQLKRRYMSLETLWTISDDQPARLSAVVN